MLTADLGNSALKLALWGALDPRASDDLRAGALAAVEPLATATFALAGGTDAGVLAADLAAFLAAAGGAAPRRAALSSVAGPERTARLAAVLGAALADFEVALVVHPDPGLENTCRHPETVGADRLFAARGALALLGRGAVVLDVGSALTVDAVEPDAVGGRRGRFLGGAIAPGPRLLAEALERGGAQLARVDPRGPVPALGRETRAALESGVVHGLRGAAFELARRVGAEAGLAAAPRVLTGGARALLLEPHPFWDGDLRVDPHLVHRGLFAALAEGSVG